ncbi:protein KRI1 homolog [Asterias rubens]|uniref:protein KRI1 homolog n=1 Tax=Asterias rubens TaxID=7604 RepID=UPI0014557467|nr:protein KRI1 homolog [Asterias rubens]
MSGSEDDLEFRINTKFAENYNKWRRKEEIQKLKDRYGENPEDDSSSSSEEEDEDAEGLTSLVEKDFLKMLSYVKSKDPRIYNKEATFFHEESSEESSDDSDEDATSTKNKKKKQKVKKAKEDKPVFLKDYERKIITEKGGHYSDEEEDVEDRRDEWFERSASPTYVQEQDMIKKSFQKALLSSGEDDSDDDTLLKKKEKTKKEKKEEEEEYIQWMKGKKEQVEDVDQAQDAAELDALRKYWTDPSLEEGEKFLRDFILNKGYKDQESDEETPAIELDEADFSEEERLLETQDEFERKYNFRYEEPDAEFIKRYPRTMADSVRTKDNKRAVKRQERKERKGQEKEHKKEELKQLKNLKKQEIMEKLEKLRQVTGNDTVGIEDVDLEGDFNPEEHDKAMKKIFDEQYDMQEGEDTKPEFEHEDWEEENWDNWKGEDYGDEEYYDENGEELDYEDPDFNMDADYDPSLSKQDNKERQAALQQELLESSSKKKKKKKMSKFTEALKAKKPVFDPNDKTFEEYIEEFYRLDYEDMIDDLPCRFKYRKVVANDFGLSTQEILAAKERELNQWASLKKTCQYRTEEEEMKDVRLFAKKGKNEAKKQRVFLSLQEDQNDSDSSGEEVPRKKQKAGKPDGQSSNSQSKKKQSPQKKAVKNPTSVAESGKKQHKLESKDILDPVTEDDHSTRTPKINPKKSPAPENPDDVASQNIKAAEFKVIQAESKELQPKVVLMDTDGGLSTSSNSPDKTDSLTDVGVSRESETRTSETPQTRKRRKRNRRRSHCEDDPKGKIVETSTSEMLEESKPSSTSKQNASGNPTSATRTKANAKAVEKKENPTAATKTNDSLNSTVGTKTKRKAENDDMKQGSKRVKIGSVSQSSERTEGNVPELDVNSAVKTDSQDGKKKRRRKKKPKNNENPNNEKPSVEQRSQGDSPATNIQPKPSLQNKTTTPDVDFSQVIKNLKKLSSKGGMRSQTPSKVDSKKSTHESASKVSSASNKVQKPTDRKADNQSSKSGAGGTPKTTRTRNKNRNRRTAKRKEQGPVKRKEQGGSVTDARLKAYGINPKKHGFRMKFLREQEAKKKQKQK